jgi:hypothetical protein
MKHLLFTVLCLGLLCQAAHAVIHLHIMSPLDNPQARAWPTGHPELQTLHDQYNNLLQTRLLPLNFTQIKHTFGPKLQTATNWWGTEENDSPQTTNEAKTGVQTTVTNTQAIGPELKQRPKDAVLPVFATQDGKAPLTLLVSGLHSTDPAHDKNHTDLYAIGDIGYVEFYSQNNGKNVQTLVLFFRADDKFVPLQAASDFPARLAWEKARFEAIKTWLDAHLQTSASPKNSGDSHSTPH